MKSQNFSLTEKQEQQQQDILVVSDFDWLKNSNRSKKIAYSLATLTD